MRTTGRWAATALVIMTIVGGCSKAADTTASGGTATKADFVKSANDLCTTLFNDFKAQPKPSSAQESKDQLDKLSDSIGDFSKKFRALAQPAGDEAKINGFADYFDKSATSGHQMATAIGSNDKDAAQKISTEMDSQQKTSEQAMKDYGLTACTQSTSSS